MATYTTLVTKDAYPTLVKRFAEGAGTVFVGAGLSIGGGLKSWSALVAPMREQLKRKYQSDQRDPAAIDALSLTEVAERFELEFGRPELIQVIRNELPRLGGGWTSAHAAILKLPLTEIFTTNYDSFIEQAAFRHGIDYNLVVEANQLAVCGPKLKIIKLHGDYDNIGEIVITERDYRNVATKKSALFHQLNASLAPKALLFLGYSFNDPDINHLISRTHRDLGILARNIYAVQFGLLDDERERLIRLGVQPIEIRLAQGQPPNDGLTNWLADFALQVEARRGPAAQPRQAPRELPPQERELIGRRKDVSKLVAMLWEPGARIILSGPVGIGKSSLALAAAYRCASDPDAFEAVILVSGGGDPLARAVEAIERTTRISLAQAGSRASAPAREKNLAAFLRYTRVLLVIDGLEGRLEAHPWLVRLLNRRDLQASLLVSTRSATGSNAAVVTVDAFSDDELLEFERSLLREVRWDHSLAYKSDHQLLAFARTFLGNPQLVRQAFKLAGSSSGLAANARRRRQDEGRISDLLHALAWRRLGPEGRAIMRTASLLPGPTISWETVRAGVGPAYSRGAIARAIEGCVALGLIEDAPPGPYGAPRYRVPPLARSFAARKLQPGRRQDETLTRLSEHFLDVVDAAVRRRRPAVRYWNALSGEGMAGLDPDWENIRTVVDRAMAQRAKDPETFLQFLMLLVHYMDSRMHNVVRKRYVECAADVFASHQDHEAAALLHLDALAWTYIGERDLEKAGRHLALGRRFARMTEGPARQDLDALSCAWLARLRLELGKVSQAGEAASRALDISCSPWIRTRVCMSAGDVALRRRDGRRALALYEEAARQPVQHYGTEGNGYEVLPRIGLALLALGEVELAREKFGLMKEAAHIPMADQYGAYGEAIAAYWVDRSERALRRMNTLRARLAEQATSGLLFRTMLQFENNLRRRAPRAAVRPRTTVRRGSVADAGDHLADHLVDGGPVITMTPTERMQRV